MPYQHFFMFHDVTWARHSKQAFSALALGNVRHQLRQICNLMQNIIRISYPEYDNEDEKYSHLQYVIAIMTFAQRYFNALKA